MNQQGREVAPPAGIRSNLDEILRRLLDPTIAARLLQARRDAVELALSGPFRPVGHWIDWAPVAMMLALALGVGWYGFDQAQQSVDAEILADSLPLDAFTDADFNQWIDRSAATYSD